MSSNGDNPIPKESIYRQLRDMILCFELYPGTRITEIEMAKHFGVSRTPIREALQRLALEGYVTLKRKQGASVKSFDVSELSQYYRVRIALEKLSLETACTYTSDSDLQQLADDWEPYSQPGRSDNSIEMENRDEEFHVALATRGGNRALAQHLTQVNDQIRIVRRLDFTDPERIDRTYDEHHAIIMYLLERDLECAKNAMVEHIKRSEDCGKSMTLIELSKRRNALASDHRALYHRNKT